jgi:UvrD-like helicase C-terminal domain
MQIENDYDNGVYNGDIGYIDDVDPEAGALIANFDGRAVTYGFGELDTLVPAYAATIHKSQGSEYPAVVIPVLTQHYAMLQRNLLYTGITRGKRLVVLVGQKKAIAMRFGMSRDDMKRGDDRLASTTGRSTFRRCDSRPVPYDRIMASRAAPRRGTSRPRTRQPRRTGGRASSLLALLRRLLPSSSWAQHDGLPQSHALPKAAVVVNENHACLFERLLNTVERLGQRSALAALDVCDSGFRNTGPKSLRLFRELLLRPVQKGPRRPYLRTYDHHQEGHMGRLIGFHWSIFLAFPYRLCISLVYAV